MGWLACLARATKPTAADIKHGPKKGASKGIAKGIAKGNLTWGRICIGCCCILPPKVKNLKKNMKEFEDKLWRNTLIHSVIPTFTMNESINK